MTNEVNSQQKLTGQKQTKRCRSNRRLQRFKRKCRSQGMNEHVTEMLTTIQKVSMSVARGFQQMPESQKEDFPMTNKQNDNTTSSILFENQVLSVLMLSDGDDFLFFLPFIEAHK